MDVGARVCILLMARVAKIAAAPLPFFETETAEPR
jgi:hypothetical protein